MYVSVSALSVVARFIATPLNESKQRLFFVFAIFPRFKLFLSRGLASHWIYAIETLCIIESFSAVALENVLNSTVEEASLEIIASSALIIQFCIPSKQTKTLFCASYCELCRVFLCPS